MCCILGDRSHCVCVCARACMYACRLSASSAVRSPPDDWNSWGNEMRWCVCMPSHLNTDRLKHVYWYVHVSRKIVWLCWAERFILRPLFSCQGKWFILAPINGWASGPFQHEIGWYRSVPLCPQDRWPIQIFFKKKYSFIFNLSWQVSFIERFCFLLTFRVKVCCLFSTVLEICN